MCAARASKVFIPPLPAPWDPKIASLSWRKCRFWPGYNYPQIAPIQASLKAWPEALQCSSEGSCSCKCKCWAVCQVVGQRMSQFKILGRVFIYHLKRWKVSVVDITCTTHSFISLCRMAQQQPFPAHNGTPRKSRSIKARMGFRRDGFVKNCAKKTATVKQLRQLYLNPMLTRI